MTSVAAFMVLSPSSACKSCGMAWRLGFSDRQNKSYEVRSGKTLFAVDLAGTLFVAMKEHGPRSS